MVGSVGLASELLPCDSMCCSDLAPIDGVAAGAAEGASLERVDQVCITSECVGDSCVVVVAVAV